MLSTALSNGHTADIKMVEQLVKRLNAKLYADHGYISQNLKQSLKEQGIELITYHRRNKPLQCTVKQQIIKAIIKNIILFIFFLL